MGLLKNTVDSEKEAQIEVESSAAFDPLLACLLQLSRLEHNPCSAKAAVAGLPLVNECLTPQLFLRAAARAGLSAKIVQRTAAEVSPVSLPAVALLQGEQARVVIRIDRDADRVVLLDQDTDGELHWSFEQFTETYTGFLILARPAYRFDQRTQNVKPHTRGHWFWGVMASSWRIYRDVLLASLLINVLALANPLFVMNVYDRVVPNTALETLWVLAIGVLAVYGFDLLLKYLRAYFVEVAGKKSDVLLSAFIWERVLGAKLSERPQSVGAFASQLREFETVRNFLTSSAVTALVDLPFSLIFLLVIAYVGGWLVWAPLVGIALIIGYALLIRRPLQESVEQTYQASAQKNATLVETLTGLETVKALGAESRLQRVWELAVGNLAFWGQKTRLLSNSSSMVSGLVQQVASVAVVVTGVYQIADKELTTGALVASVMLCSRALGPMAQVAALLVSFEQTKTAFQSLEKIVDKSQERDTERRFIQRPLIRGAIRFDRVSFAYPGDQQASLNNVSFTIQPGERVGIIGRIGSGKSTLQRLILGLYSPQQGAVLVDDIDLQQIDPADIRGSVGYVPQDVTLFFGSVKDNICYGAPHAEDEEIIRVAEVAGVTEFTNQHPQGLDRQVGERGLGLSGGQRQSVVIARALLNRPPIYILDEPSTAMDHSTEERLKQGLLAETQGKTLIMVTHKTSLLTLVDRILVMEGGRLIADGPKASVLEALKKGQLRVS